MVKIKNYINGQWVESESEKFLVTENPGTGEALSRIPVSTEKEVSQAVESAKNAFSKWREIPPIERARYFFKLKNLMEEHAEELARTITIEHGKILPEARGEIRRAIENVEVACGIPSLMQGKILEDAAKDIDSYFVRMPIGVFAMIAPFNFPAMIPMWFLPYAVACGNTYIVKPSEQVPLTMSMIFSLMDTASFPKGVINLVNGNKDTVNTLIEHPDIVGISSVTSTPVAKEIYKKAAQFGKRAQCHAGAKNFLVVMPDANLEKTIPNITDSIYGNTGQRCLAGANVVAVGNVYTELKKQLVETASKIKIGYGLDKSVDMGPVISAKAKERIIGYIEKGLKEGAKLILDGRNVKVEKYPNGYYLGPSIFDEVTPDMTIAKEEIFGPAMMILATENLNKAIEMINANPYGNGAIIYTESGKSAKEFEYKVNCGNIGIHIGLPAPMAFFPFSGMKNSFFGDLHGQGQDAVDFFTHKKVIMQRWW